MPFKALIIFSSALVLGCAAQPNYTPSGRTDLVNADGHVFGYEERIAGGSILRNLSGKVIGERWVDMRNRGSNPGNGGIAIVYLQ